MTLFHLCEFWFESNAPYAAMNDAGVLDLLAGRVKRGGLLVFYTGSFAYETAAKLIPAAVEKHGFLEEPGFETLRLFRKTA